VLRFRGGLVLKAHRLVYHSTLGLRVIQKKKRRVEGAPDVLVREVPANSRQFSVHESGPLRAVHLLRHKWPGGLVNLSSQGWRLHDFSVMKFDQEQKAADVRPKISSGVVFIMNTI